MAVLDICARSRHQNGGIMRIDDILAAYRRKQTNAITKYLPPVAGRTSSAPWRRPTCWATPP